MSYEKQYIIFYKELEKDDEDYEINEDNNNIANIIFCFDNNYCVFTDDKNYFKIFDMKAFIIKSIIYFHKENILKLINSNIIK